MEKTISIDGMMCSHCTTSVQKALEEMEAVMQVTVSLEGKNAKIILNKEITDDIIKEVINRAGYEVTSIH